jgi:hypothetical protein
MKIISFDIGINNLSYCIFDIISEYSNNNTSGTNVPSENTTTLETNTLETNTPKQPYTIADWNVLNINIDGVKKPTIHYLTRNIIKLFDELPLFLECNKVVIENQPCMKNPVMKSIQMIVYSYFAIRGVTDNKTTSEIVLMSASNKMKVYDGPPIELAVKSKYTRNKKLAILHTQYILKDVEKLEFFNTHKKKDDLADAYLQGLFYIKRCKFI